jgi:hypothetical protein
MMQAEEVVTLSQGARGAVAPPLALQIGIQVLLEQRPAPALDSHACPAPASPDVLPSSHALRAHDRQLGPCKA